MANSSDFVFDADMAQRYVPRPSFAKHAVMVWESATYELTWGTQQFDGPHMRVLGEAPYGVELRTFFATHRPLPDKPHHYVKDVAVLAIRTTEPTELTTVVDGKTEATAEVPAGAYIIQNPSGELYYNSAEEFEARYMQASEA